QDIWRGPRMRRIRDALVRQRLPPECRSNSCPIYRGDAHTYLIERMDGRFRRERTGTDDPQAEYRARLQASRLEVAAPRIDHGEPIGVRLTFECSSEWVHGDLFVSVTFPNRQLRFLPELTEYPFPFARRVELGSWLEPLVIDCFPRRHDRSLRSGT